MEALNILALLNGASPWWWVAFAVLVGVAEILTFSYFLIWIALAALGVAGALVAAPGMNGMAQLALFAVLALVFTVAGRYWQAHRKTAPSESPALNRRAERVVGRTGRALADFSHGEGVVEIDGVRWSARLQTAEDAAAGRSLRVVSTDGMTLICTLA